MTEAERKFSITKADHTGFTVSSLSEALAYWNGVPGFEIVTEFNLGGELLENVTGVAGAEVSIAAVAFKVWQVDMSVPGHTCTIAPFEQILKPFCSPISLTGRSYS